MFEMVTGRQPIHVHDFILLLGLFLNYLDFFCTYGDLNANADKMIKRMSKLHEEIGAKIEACNAKYKAYADKHRRSKVFNIGDLVMVHLRKERFFTGTCNKVKHMKIETFQILKNIN